MKFVKLCVLCIILSLEVQVHAEDSNVAVKKNVVAISAFGQAMTLGIDYQRSLPWGVALGVGVTAGDEGTGEGIFYAFSSYHLQQFGRGFYMSLGANYDPHKLAYPTVVPSVGAGYDWLLNEILLKIGLNYMFPPADTHLAPTFSVGLNF